jgi:hypothetical protein
MRLEQKQKDDCDRGHQHIVRERRARDQPPIAGGIDDFGECDAQADCHHHLDQGDGDEEVDQPVGRHGDVRDVTPSVRATTSRDAPRRRSARPSSCVAHSLLS